MTQGQTFLYTCGRRKPKSTTLTSPGKAMENRRLFNSSRLKRLLKRNGFKENGAAKVLCSPSFPFYYLVRNLEWLNREKWWKALSPPAKRAAALKIVSERLSMFNEVKKWRKGRNTGTEPGAGRFSSLALSEAARQNPSGTDAPPYCNKCGLCCEVASGMPDFPPPEALPGGWRNIFANGLGPGHRFCPFLWEDNGSGGGFCSIYPLRSNPCRLFGPEECEFFWQSPEPVELSKARDVLLNGRWLIKLVNPRKLPLAGARTPAKGPKFLKFDGV